MCAGTVVAPGPAISAGMVSITSRSRSVAFTASFAFSPRIRTFARIGMVLRRSTTRWTWPRHLRSADRSTVTFMWDPARRGAASRAARTKSPPARLTRARGKKVARPAGFGKVPRHAVDKSRTRLLGLLQQALQEFDLLRECRVVAGERLDLAHGVQHGGVVAPAEAPADLRQGPSR